MAVIQENSINNFIIDLVATNDIHYTFKEDAEAHDILLCIQTYTLYPEYDSRVG